MKKITAFLGLVGVVSMISACSDTVTGVNEEENEQAQAITSSSSSATGAKPTSSSQKTSNGIVLDEITSSGSATGSGEVIHDTITTQVIISSTSNYTAPYYSSGGPFCWSENCPGASSPSTATSSSSISLEVTLSSEAPVYPTVTETQMIDQRDQKMYKLQTIAGMHWMAENLNYETADGSFCKTASSEDMCGTYGRFYTITAARKACPLGWRLPTQEEVEALDAAVPHEWWSVGGRFKLSNGEATDYGDADKQGYFWLSTGNAWKIKNFDGDQVHGLQEDAADRAYNIRCVENK